MSYYITLIKSNVILKRESQDEIFKRWKKLNSSKNNALKHGKGPQGRWYSGMDVNYDKKASNITDILSMMNFEYEISQNHDIHLTYYNDKNKQLQLFFQTIADLVDEHTSMVWQGEDDYEFMWIFENKNLYEVDVSFAKDDDYNGYDDDDEDEDLADEKPLHAYHPHNPPPKTVEKEIEKQQPVPEKKEIDLKKFW